MTTEIISCFENEQKSVVFSALSEYLSTGKLEFLKKYGVLGARIDNIPWAYSYIKYHSSHIYLHIKYQIVRLKNGFYDLNVKKPYKFVLFKEPL